MRARDLGLRPGRLAPGPRNALSDVKGVKVGHCTLIQGAGRLRVGQGPVRTGVTAVVFADDLYEAPMLAGSFVLSGTGDMAGLEQVREWGVVETPVVLTNTLSVGAASEGVVRWLLGRYPDIGQEENVVLPLVGECDDSWLNDIAGLHVRPEHAVQAIEAAMEDFEEGNVGGGTGLSTFECSGGLGTASRVAEGYTVGALVMSNFGELADLRMDGIPAGEILMEEWEDEEEERPPSGGSAQVVVATDAPLLPLQLSRLARRAALGLARTGSYASSTSCELVLAVSTAHRMQFGRRRTQKVEVLLDTEIDPLYLASVEAVEESVLNALCASRDMDGVNGRKLPRLPLDRVRAIVDRYRSARGG